MASDMSKAQRKQSTGKVDETARAHRLEVLVVEDEPDLQELLEYNLVRDGFAARCASTGEQALQAIREKVPDLVLLDLMLPGMDGFEVCRTLRRNDATANLPVVILTARGEEADIVAGLELGADDYATKPFSPRVLVARLKAVLRRHHETANHTENTAIIRHHDLVIDTERHEARLGDDVLELTSTAFKLLGLLASRPGRVFTRSQIIKSLHGNLAAVTDRSVDVQMLALRRKLGDHADLIETVRGVGYRLKD